MPCGFACAGKTNEGACENIAEGVAEGVAEKVGEDVGKGIAENIGNGDSEENGAARMGELSTNLMTRARIQPIEGIIHPQRRAGSPVMGETPTVIVALGTGSGSMP